MIVEWERAIAQCSIKNSVGPQASHQTLAGGGERVGDTLLLPGKGSTQMEVRMTIAAHGSAAATTDAFGIAVKAQPAPSGGTYLLESTR